MDRRTRTDESQPERARSLSSVWSAGVWTGWRTRRDAHSYAGRRCAPALSSAGSPSCARGAGGGSERGESHRHTEPRAYTPSRRRLRLRGAYRPPSIISMRISIFHPVFPKFMQTSESVLPRSRGPAIASHPRTGGRTPAAAVHTGGPIHLTSSPASRRITCPPDLTSFE